MFIIYPPQNAAFAIAHQVSLATVIKTKAKYMFRTVAMLSFCFYKKTMTPTFILW